MMGEHVSRVNWNENQTREYHLLPRQTLDEAGEQDFPLPGGIV
jgi:hypothetical protein